MALTFRPLAPGELDTFLSLPGHQGSRHPFIDRDYQDVVAARHYRPEWSWVAERDGRLVARAAWWGFPGAEHPIALDWFDLGPSPDRVEVGAGLLNAAREHVRTAAGDQPDYHLFLSPRWRQQPELRPGVEDRLRAAEAAGMRLFVERFRFEWAPSDGLPELTGRLTFQPVAGASSEELVQMLRRINEGTLDAYTGRDVARSGAERAAAIILEELDELPGPREWWRLAYAEGGQLVGITVPSRNFQHPVVGFVGVLPEHRGHGYARELLVHATRFLSEQGAERILADTDTKNEPMAAAFRAAGYRNTAVRIVLEAAAPRAEAAR